MKALVLLGFLVALVLISWLVVKLVDWFDSKHQEKVRAEELKNCKHEREFYNNYSYDGSIWQWGYTCYCCGRFRPSDFYKDY